MLLKISTGKVSTKHQFDDECTYLALINAIAEVTKIPEAEIEVLMGFPPQLIHPQNLNELAKNLGITSGTTLTVRQNTSKREVVSILQEMGFPTPMIVEVAHLMQTNTLDEAILLCEQLGSDGLKDTNNQGGISQLQQRQMSIHTIPADNSCLFNAIDFLLNGSSATNTKGPMFYRQIVANKISSDPVLYNEDFLEKKPAEYIAWILNPEKWGGEIELSIISSELKIEIAVVDIQTTLSLVYGNDAGYLNRIFLIYDGSHYDAVIDSNNAGIEGRLFAAGADDVLEEVKRIARDRQKKRQFTNLRSGGLLCKECDCVFMGQKEAVEHAKQTGHTNFGEVV